MTEAEEELGTKIDINKIRLYPAMNEKIAGLLKIRDDDVVSMYAAKLIGDLQKRVAIKGEEDEVVIAIMKPKQSNGENDVAFIEHCLEGVKNNGWCYRIVKYTEKGWVNPKPITPPPGIPGGRNPVIPGRVNDCVCLESWDC